MKKNFLSIFIILFVLVFSICLVFIPKVEFSENENRYLEKFPKFSFDSLMSGKFISSFESYLTDHFPLRDTFMGIKTKYQLFMGQKLINGVYVGKDEYLIQKYNNPVNTNKLINKLNEFYDKNQINMNIMLVPSSGVINSEKLPDNVSFDLQLETLKYIYDNLKFDGIDVTNALKEGNKIYNMYYRLDHHWTTYGAYYGYVEFCKKNNIQPISLKEFRHVEITNGFNGTLYSKANIYTYKPDKIDIFLNDNKLKVNYVMSNRVTDTLYEDKHLSTKDKYAYFLDANHPLIQITNEEKEGEILVIKDSYANSFIPFLTNHYNKVHVIDLRFYNLSVTDYIKENDIKDVLFLYSMQGIDDDLGIYNIR